MTKSNFSSSFKSATSSRGSFVLQSNSVGSIIPIVRFSKSFSISRTRKNRTFEFLSSTIGTYTLTLSSPNSEEEESSASRINTEQSTSCNFGCAMYTHILLAFLNASNSNTFSQITFDSSSRLFFVVVSGSSSREEEKVAFNFALTRARNVCFFSFCRSFKQRSSPSIEKVAIYTEDGEKTRLLEEYVRAATNRIRDESIRTERVYCAVVTNFPPKSGDFP